MNSIDTFDSMDHDDNTRKGYFGGDETMGQPALKVDLQVECLWVTTGRAKNAWRQLCEYR
ncbi:hypothetical protein [Alicyclobacillus suci]|uniref:hypothetical protein n=1 Tax=Alicyclobacillus suci TaxID=2816080 RepID=UPI001A8EA0DC|nr:hypothetical protein [Alicyclobacillus suci]